MPDCQEIHYMQASWKGLSFYIETTEDQFGQYGEPHEPLGTSKVFTESTRRMADRFSVSGFFWGDGHLDQYRQFVKVCRDDIEPGVFVHPVLGSQRVKLKQLSGSAEYQDAQGEIKISLDFVEAGSNSIIGSSPELLIQTLRGAWFGNSAGNSLFDRLGVAGNLFNSGFSLTGLIPAIANNSLREVSRFGELANRHLLQGVAWGRDLIQGVNYTRNLIENPRTFLNYFNMISLIDQIRISKDSTEGIFNSLQDIMNFGPGIIYPAGQTAANINTLTGLVRTQAIISSVHAMTEHDYFNNYSDALDYLDHTQEILDAEIKISEQTNNDQLYEFQRKLKIELIKQVHVLGDILPSKIVTDVCGHQPSLVAAYKAYGDADRAVDVENANGFRTSFAIGPTIEIVK